MFCVYLTTYSGDKFPMYYIGSTSKTRLDSGYVGSVASKRYRDLWKSEVKNNRHLFSVTVLSEHMSRAEAFAAELAEQIKRDVVKSTEYVNRAFARAHGRFSGIDQTGPNNPMYGKKTTEEAKAKISAALSGVKKSQAHRENMKKAWLSRDPFSEQAIQNMIDARPRGAHHPFFGKKRPGLGAKLSEATAGILWWNNGVEAVRSKTQPGPEWSRGKGDVWWNNGVASTKSRTSPGPEWSRGRIKSGSTQSSL